MATSTNYLWTEPNDSDLVTNGALAIRTLGNAIDTSLWNSGYGQAGKNKIINGGFDVWQRGTSFANPSVSSYTADRWLVVTNHTGGTVTYSRQTFTGTDLPVAGAQYYLRAVGAAPTGQSFYTFDQKIENVQTFAGQTITLSFYAKADAARNVTPAFYQNFGGGGSGQVSTTGTAIALTTSWARYSQTFTIPSITGKTIGTSSFLQLQFTLPNNVASSTFDFYGVQAEYGAKATPFQTASGGSIQGELAMCRYYYSKFDATTNSGNDGAFNTGVVYSSTIPIISLTFPQMRTRPSFASSGSFELVTGGAVTAITSLVSTDITNFSAGISGTISGLTAGQACLLRTGSSTSGIIELSAEL
jgi:hypothetical protein